MPFSSMSISLNWNCKKGTHDLEGEKAVKKELQSNWARTRLYFYHFYNVPRQRTTRIIIRFIAEIPQRVLKLTNCPTYGIIENVPLAEYDVVLMLSIVTVYIASSERQRSYVPSSSY